MAMILNGSGGSGPIAGISKYFERNQISASFLLTDLFPNLAAFRRLAAKYDSISFIDKPVDAMACTQQCDVRTMCASFHHFTPEQGIRLLSDPVKNKQSICVFESTFNSLYSWIGVFQ